MRANGAENCIKRTRMASWATKKKGKRKDPVISFYFSASWISWNSVGSSTSVFCNRTGSSSALLTPISLTCANKFHLDRSRPIHTRLLLLPACPRGKAERNRGGPDSPHRSGPTKFQVQTWIAGVIVKWFFFLHVETDESYLWWSLLTSEDDYLPWMGRDRDACSWSRKFLLGLTAILFIFFFWPRFFFLPFSIIDQLWELIFGFYCIFVLRLMMSCW